MWEAQDRALPSSTLLNSHKSAPGHMNGPTSCVHWGMDTTFCGLSPPQPGRIGTSTHFVLTHQKVFRAGWEEILTWVGLWLTTGST